MTVIDAELYLDGVIKGHILKESLLSKLGEELCDRQELVRYADDQCNMHYAAESGADFRRGLRAGILS